MQTPFVIAFDRDVVAITDAPADWLDLLHHGWSEDVSLPDPGRSREGATFVTSVIAEKLRSEGDPVIGFDWLEQLDRQIGRYDADARESLRSMRMHRVSLAVVPRAVVEVGRVEWEGRLYYRAPESGSPSMVRAVAVVATASGEGSDMAQRFADHVQSPELLAATKLHTHWEPVGSWDERTLPEGFELRQAWSAYPSSVGLSVDSATVWIRRWSSDVRGRGK
jgi:ABC-type Fe3+ transport system substrate-binding protein